MSFKDNISHFNTNEPQQKFIQQTFYFLNMFILRYT